MHAPTVDLGTLIYLPFCLKWVEEPTSISSVNETLLRAEISAVVGSRVPLCKSEASVMLMVMMRLLPMIQQFGGLGEALNSEQFGEMTATILWSSRSFRFIALCMEEESHWNVTSPIRRHVFPARMALLLRLPPTAQ